MNFFTTEGELEDGGARPVPVREIVDGCIQVSQRRRLTDPDLVAVSESSTQLSDSYTVVAGTLDSTLEVDQGRSRTSHAWRC